MAKAVKQVPKKPYIKPMLTVYGTVRELTLMVGSAGMKDGGSTPGKKHSHIP